MKKTLLFLLITIFTNAQWSISTSERNALISIYNQSNGAQWSQTWDLTKDPYYWHGVKISNGIVTELNLSGNLLEGNFPASIFSLTNLKKLDLSSNRLSGITPDLSPLSHLTSVNLSNNNLTGDIWKSFSTLTNLEEIYVGNNNCTISSTDFSGFINLKSLDISKLNIVEIPQSLSTLQNLTSLNISENKISNYSNLNLLSKLQELNLSGNSITSLPNEISSLKSLKTLNLSNNSITNFSSLNSLSSLEWLSLENNSLANIPSEVSSLQNLIHLNLGRNNITGGVNILLPLENLEQLWLNHNKLKGNIPSQLLTLPKIMSISIQSNELEGSIPNNIPPIFNISNNKFTKTEIEDYLKNNSATTDFVYSPQRYDSPKTVKAALNSSASLDQDLSSSEGYQFTWFKTLDKNTNINTETYSINSVKETDFDVYTCEALFIKNDTLYNIYFSDYREPISLENAITLSTEDPKNRILAIYPNPTKDYINITNKNYKIESFSLYDIGGRLIKTTSGKESKIDVSSLPSATYILNIKTSEGFQSFKIIKK